MKLCAVVQKREAIYAQLDINTLYIWVMCLLWQMWSTLHSLSDVSLWQELIMLTWPQSLPVPDWVVYMQLTNVDNMSDTANNFVFPKYKNIFTSLGWNYPVMSSTQN